MKNKLVIGLFFLTELSFSQTSDATNIKGRWKRLYDTDAKNTKTIPATLDTISFLSGNKYVCKDGGSTTTAKWSINSKTRVLNLADSKTILYVDGKLIDLYDKRDWRRIDKLSNDTLVFIHYDETDGKTVSSREFYAKIK